MVAKCMRKYGTPMGFSFSSTIRAVPKHSSPQLTPFQYDIGEMLRELNSCFHQLAYVKTGFVIHHFAYGCRTYHSLSEYLTVFQLSLLPDSRIVLPCDRRLGGHKTCCDREMEVEVVCVTSDTDLRASVALPHSLFLSIFPLPS